MMRDDLRQLKDYIAEDPAVYARVALGNVLVGGMELLGISALIPMVAVFLGEPLPRLPAVIAPLVQGLSPLALGAAFGGFILFQTGLSTLVERRFVRHMGRWRTSLSLEYIESILASDFFHHRDLNPGEMEVMITRNIGFAMKIRHRTALFLSDSVLAVFYVAIALAVSAYTFLLFLAVGGIYALINRFTLHLRVSHSQVSKDRYFSCARHVAEFFSDTRTLLTYEKSAFIRKVQGELEEASQAQQSTDALNVLIKQIHQPVMLVLILCAAAAAKLSLGLENSRILVMLYVFYRAAPKIIEVAKGYGEIIGESPTDVTPDIKKWKRRAQRPAPPGGELPGSTGIRLARARVDSGGRALFRDAELEVPDKAFVLVSGESGTGKSTLLDVLCGLHELAEGTLEIGGVPSARLDFERFRRERVALVRPESVVVTGSIAENIAYLGRLDEPGMEEVSRLLRLESFLGGREGLRTPIDPRGANLSAGQRQRIVLARALYKRPGLLLLDEPTSNLDAVTEADVLRALETLKGRVTIVAVSHQAAVGRLADAAYRIEGGRLLRA